MSEDEPSAGEARWSLPTRIAFRFAFCYFLLYFNPVMFEPVPYVRNAVAKYYALWETIVPPVAQALFGIRITTFTNGSGDTTFDYLKVLCLLILSAVLTLVWSILDRRRMHYARLHEWLRIYVRFALGITMMAYGAAKVFQTQFPDPTLDRLLQSFGDASPMGLLWTFMGTSKAFSAFTGIGEMLAGLLLTARRTTLLGALLTIAVMSNIVAMNFCYDVPVKLFSLHLLAMAFFLVLPDLRRLVDTFLRHRPSEVFRSRALRAAAIALRTLVVAYVAFMLLYNNREAMKKMTAARSPLHGIWNVEPAGQPQGWQRVIFDHPRFFAVQTMNDSRMRYALTVDERKQTMTLNAKDTLVYRRPDASSLLLDGSVDGQPVHALLRRASTPAFRLTSRGFHWINETPFNR